MSKLKSFAEQEFDILEKTVDQPVIKEFRKEILALVDKFGESGQSGASAPYVAGAISSAVKNLLLFKPICDVTGHDAEWVDTGHDVYQNNRCSSLFKDGKNGRAYFLDAIVWKTQTRQCFTGGAFLNNGEKVFSRNYVKFPFVPKTFYVDVTEKEVKPDDWEFTVKNEKQLEEAFAYYDKFDK